MDAEKISQITKKITQLAEGYQVEMFSINVTPDTVEVSFKAVKVAIPAA